MTAKQIIDNLDKIYERKSKVTQVSVRKKLLQLNLNSESTSIKHITEFE